MYVESSRAAGLRPSEQDPIVSSASWSWPNLRAAAVHVYTATGAVLALLIVLAAIEGEVARALWLGLAALVIDGTDGMLARRFRVKERIPLFDGATLDNIVDYLTYVFAPVVLLLQGGYLPAGSTGTLVAAIPLVASAYQFCRVDAKAEPGTEDHFFRGFPSYWNVVAFYAIALDLGPGTVSAIVVICALLVPVPIGYLYPSRTRDFRPLTLALSAVWLLAYAVIVAQLPDPHPFWLALSLVYIAYYLGMSLLLEARRRAARAGAPAAALP